MDYGVVTMEHIETELHIGDIFLNTRIARRDMEIYNFIDRDDDNEDVPHEVSELICLRCFRRRITVYPTSLLLADMECECGAVGFLIKTGQTLPEEEENGNR